MSERVGDDAANAPAPQSGGFSVVGPPSGGPNSGGLPVSHGSEPVEPDCVGVLVQVGDDAAYATALKSGQFSSVGFIGPLSGGLASVGPTYVGPPVGHGL